MGGGENPPAVHSPQGDSHGTTEDPLARRLCRRGDHHHVHKFFSITDCNAEPTGIYFSASGRSLFVNIQHRSGDGRDASIAIQKIAKIDFLRTQQ